MLFVQNVNLVELPVLDICRLLRLLIQFDLKCELTERVALIDFIVYVPESLDSFSLLGVEVLDCQLLLPERIVKEFFVSHLWLRDIVRIVLYLQELFLFKHQQE